MPTAGSERDAVAPGAGFGLAKPIVLAWDGLIVGLEQDEHLSEVRETGRGPDEPSSDVGRKSGDQPRGKEGDLDDSSRICDWQRSGQTRLLASLNRPGGNKRPRL